MKGVRTLGQMTGTDQSDNTSVKIWTGGKVQAVASHVTEILEGAYEEDVGKTSDICERGGLQFVVHEPIWDRPVKCIVPEGLVDTALNASRRRVEVYGPVRYRRNGEPTSVAVEDMTVFPDPAAHPSYRDLRGILRNFG